MESGRQIMNKILAVDNDVFIREFLTDILSNQGYKVVTASDGLTALDILKTYTPDVIFVDLVMPNIDGKKLCKIIRGLKEFDKTRIIVLSSIAAEEKANIVSVGANRSIVKGPLAEMARNVLDSVENPESDFPDKVTGIEKVDKREITGELLSVKIHFEVILEKMSDGILEITEGRIVYANPSALNLTKISEEKLLGSYFADLFGKNDRSYIDDLINTEDGDKITHSDKKLALNDYIVTLDMLSLDDEKTKKVIIIRNISDREFAEKALLRHNLELSLLNKASQAVSSSLELDKVFETVLEEVRNLMSVSGTTIWLTDLNTGELVCQKATGSWGSSLQGLRIPEGQGLAGWVADNNKSLLVSDAINDSRHFKGVDLMTGTSMRSILGVPIRLKKEVIGVLQVVDTNPGRFDPNHVSLLEALAGSAAISIENARLYLQAQKEMSSRKRAEELFQQNKIIEAIINSLPALVIIIKEDGRLEKWNKQLENTTGISSLETGQMSFFDFILPKDRESAKNMIEDIFVKGTGDFVAQLAVRGGKYVPYYINCSRTQLDNETYIVAVGLDMSERIRQQEEKQVLQAQLSQAHKMESVGTLAGGIAHDFNNMLTPIVGFTELALDDIPPESDAHSNLTNVIKAADRAKDLVQQILTFSRQTEQKRVPMNPQPVITETIKLLRSSIPKTIEITTNIDKNCGNVFSDPSQIHQIIMNLCTNAYHAMEKKGGRLDVSLTGALLTPETIKNDPNMKVGDFVKLTVRDSGHGIEKSILDKIFEPYFTTKEPGKGTGLGLSLVHGIVQIHGGFITVDSSIGKGTAFSVYLPKIDIKKPETAVTAGGVIPRGNENILLVDDEEQILMMMKQMMGRLGYNVTEINSSSEALMLFSANPEDFDLVITDMTMPKMSGVDLSYEMMKIRKDIPIILYSGFNDMSLESKAKALGIREIVMKPVSKTGIAEAIRRVLDKGKNTIPESPDKEKA
ncbi:MAG: response regulator [Desulfobacteraceae bacterium]|nr:MAG: response regulator [Desulfobacteraceae bacterium]